VDAVSADARQANDLIDRRTFSWTELFNRFERTLPADVRITAVQPTIDRDRQIHLLVTVLARTVDDVNQFMENLDQTRAFVDLRSSSESATEDGQITSALDMIYKPAMPGEATAQPAGAAQPAAAGGAR
jgi:Tfp pilus assembly protein PilN